MPTKPIEEEIGHLPDKEFQIMTVKMIQNLGSKLELEINSLETRIYNGKKTTSLTSGAGKTGQPLVKE